LKHAPILVVLGLAIAVAIVFGQTASFDFVTLDDPEYVTENPHVKRGLTADGLRWAFSSLDASNWHPLTWLSHMADCEMHGLDAGGHHLSNVVLHAAAAILLFLALRSLTGALWPSALVAALFAIHPLRAESVAWIAERKDVLSGMLSMGVLLVWAWYVKRPSTRRYLAVAGVFALGLMAKPMLVTLPFVLLLLDVWPLRRIQFSGDPSDRPGRWWLLRDRAAGRLVAEKIPLILMATASSVVTILAQRSALGGFEELPLVYRFTNALVAWVAYIAKSLVPTCLAAFYPHPSAGVPLWQALGAGLILAAVSVAAIHQLRARPYLAVGWLWFVGTLVPVIGLVQVGSQSMADRYSYFPQIGLWVMLAWGLDELLRERPRLRSCIGAGAIVVIAAFMVLCWRQTASWASSTALYGRALACTSGNWLAHANLAEILVGEGRFEEAARHATRSLEIHPDNPVPAIWLGNAMLRLDRPRDALEAYELALRSDPGSPLVIFNMGKAYRQTGDVERALECYREVLERDPKLLSARTELGVELMLSERNEAAVAMLCSGDAAQLQDHPLQFNCGLALARVGRNDEAAARFRRATELAPGHLASWTGLGMVLERMGKKGEAAAAARRALRIDPNDVRALRLLERTSTGSTAETPSGRGGGDGV
jgi:tetratricopeptide (TPR) repeat protein